MLMLLVSGENGESTEPFPTAWSKVLTYLLHGAESFLRS